MTELQMLLKIIEVLEKHVDSLERRHHDLQKRVTQLETERAGATGTTEPLMLPPSEPCVDPDGHWMIEIQNMMSAYPAAAFCERCGKSGRVKRDTTPQDADPDKWVDEHPKEDA